MKSNDNTKSESMPNGASSQGAGKASRYDRSNLARSRAKDIYEWSRWRLFIPKFHRYMQIVYIRWARIVKRRYSNSEEKYTLSR